MTRSPILAGTLAALLILPAAAFAGPRGGGAATGAPTMSAPTTAAGSAVNTSASAPVAKGQPNQSCQAAGSATPGNAGSPSNTGSPFSPNGQSGTVYAGQQPQTQNNPVTNSQYDVACTKGGR